MKTFEHPATDSASFVKTDYVITSVTVETLGSIHDRVTIFNRGGNAGHIFVKAGDGETIAHRLLGSI